MIRNTFSKPTRNLGTALLATLALFSMANAQNSDIVAAETNSTVDYSNWYQIEVIIFARHSSASSEELWPKNIVLAYPPNVRYLIDPNAPQVTEKETDAEAVLPVDDGELPPNPEVVKETSEDLTEKNTTQNTLQNDGQAFTLLGDNSKLLQKESSSLSHERGVKVLLHEVWRQPVSPLEEATAVVIEGGDKFGEHYELEGTLTIGVSRYLHAQTNLWLSQFEPNYGQDSYHWPPLPAKPTDITKFEQDNVNLADLSTGDNDWTTKINLTPAANNSFAFNTPELLSPQERAIIQAPYLISKIVTLDQRRKMRSGELHYIDHPLLGVIIQIQPYAPKEEKQEEKN